MSVNEDRLREALRTVDREVEVSEEDTAHAQHRVRHYRSQQVSQRQRRSAAALTATAVLAVAIGSAVGIQRIATDSVPPAGPYQDGNGWVAIDADDGGGDIYLVRPGEEARLLEVPGSKAGDEACPVWSPDGRRLMFGRVTGSPDGTSSGAELVIVPVGQSGEAGTPTVIGLDGFEVLEGFDPHPCATWAPDGRWVALAGTGEVWVVDTQTSEIRQLPDLRPSDLEWRPGSDELAIAGDMGANRSADTEYTPVRVYSVSADDLRPLGSTEAAHMTWSPDGTTLAYTAGENGPPELWLVDGDGGNTRLLVANPAGVSHGIGPVWSPTGDRIAYQRHVLPLARERHEVVLVDVVDGTETVIHPPVAEGWVWYPFTVSWSPDGTALLYAAWGDVGGEGSNLGLLAVPVDTPGSVTVLTDAIDFRADSTSHQWAPVQMWGRQPG